MTTALGDYERSRCGTPNAGAEPAVRRQIVEVIEALSARLRWLSHAVHDLAEVGFAEVRSAALVADLLAEQGFPAAIGTAGLATSFRASAGDGSPRVAVLAEYDALPGIGHACGHNIICASAVGAFLGVASRVTFLGGSVILLGTPAEENGAGKEVLARAGALDGVDAAVMLHPFSGRDVANFNSLAVRDVEATFHGFASHASSAPHMGRNALDAVVAAYQALAALRQHILSTDRLHAIITDGGSATNVVPDRASLVIEVRSLTVDGLLDLSDRVQQILEGAAQLTGTRVEARWDPFPAYLPVRSNAPLAQRYAQHMTYRDRDVAESVPGLIGGGWSTDLGNLSVRLPTIHPTLAITPDDVSIHTPRFAQLAVSKGADAAMIDGAVGLALTMADYLADADVREAVNLDFQAGGGAIDVEQAMLEPAAKR